jgi:hypothetical protein
MNIIVHILFADIFNIRFCQYLTKFISSPHPNPCIPSPSAHPSPPQFPHPFPGTKKIQPTSHGWQSPTNFQRTYPLCSSKNPRFLGFEMRMASALKSTSFTQPFNSHSSYTKYERWHATMGSQGNFPFTLNLCMYPIPTSNLKII